MSSAALSGTLALAALRRLAPPPKLTVSEWADAHRVLSREASAEPGQWRTSRAPYQREVMDVVTDPLVADVVLIWAAQTGKTECLNNIVGYQIDRDPGPMLVLQPTLEMAQAWSKDRLAPMLRDTPVLRGRVRDPRSKDSSNTLLHKVFPGGHITIVGANSPAGLAARPIRVVLADEVDRYPASAGTEGDPVALAERRTATFHTRKRIKTSTPTLKGLSRIEREFAETDQRRYHVPCPACGHFQPLVWGHLKWDKDAAGADLPDTAAYACAGCGVLLPETDKGRMLAGGRWVATYPDRAKVGFHLNALYSPWARWPDLVTEFLAAKHQPALLQVFVNTVLAETWEEHAGELDPTGLVARREPYEAAVPDGALVLTAGVDVQGDRLECHVWGWGADDRSWLVARRFILGDPGTEGPWAELDAYLMQRFPGTGRDLPIWATAVDSGYHTASVYRFCSPRYARRIYAVKGLSTPGAPLVKPKPTIVGKAPYRCRLFTYGPDAAKDLFYARLKIARPGPGYVALPAADWCDLEFLVQLTSERPVRRQIAGRWVRRYEAREGVRNEALDAALMARTALALSQWTPDRLAKAAAGALPTPTPPPATETVAPPTQEPPVLTPDPAFVVRTKPFRAPRRGRWVDGWK